MPKISLAVQTFIVQRLACYDSPTQVATAVKEQFGLILDRRQVEGYDAERAGQKPARRWIELFHATRERFKETVDDIPIAQSAVRLHRLNRMALRAEEKGNMPLAAALLEQAAKERGGAFTNRREVTGRGGTPLLPPTAVQVTLVAPSLLESPPDPTPASASAAIVDAIVSGE